MPTLRLLALATLLLAASCSPAPCAPDTYPVEEICALATTAYCARCLACGTCSGDCEERVLCDVPVGLECDGTDAWTECVETLVDPDCSVPLDCGFLLVP